MGFLLFLHPFKSSLIHPRSALLSTSDPSVHSSTISDPSFWSVILYFTLIWIFHELLLTRFQLSSFRVLSARKQFHFLSTTVSILLWFTNHLAHSLSDWLISRSYNSRLQLGIWQVQRIRWYSLPSPPISSLPRNNRLLADSAMCGLTFVVGLSFPHRSQIHCPETYQFYCPASIDLLCLTTFYKFFFEITENLSTLCCPRTWLVPDQPIKQVTVSKSTNHQVGF